jgi:16S rRNA (cytosine1402-N4)-methyltransferase
VETTTHVPVLLAEAIESLVVRPGGFYVDATFGRGGHSRAILERLGPAGRLAAFDRDPVAVEHARALFAGDPRFEIHQGPFSMMPRALDATGWRGRVQGILFDLGVSSPQLDDPGRGFSFRSSGPLDMRMDPTTGESAAGWISHATEAELERVIRDLGEERFARRVARAIVRAREEAPITTTSALADIVRRAVPTRERGQDKATRTFQAIRLHINRELDELARVLPQAVELLAPGGRLAVISFHSLEDRIVKQFMQREARGDPLPHRLPVRETARVHRLQLVGRMVRAGDAEVARNSRARSAVLRVAERTAHA